MQRFTDPQKTTATVGAAAAETQTRKDAASIPQAHPMSHPQHLDVWGPIAASVAAGAALALAFLAGGGL